MKPQLSKYGRKALWRAVRAIERMPKTFDMGDWLSHNPEVKPKKGVPAPYCGTAACIAGHLALGELKEAPDVWHSIPIPSRFRARLGGRYYTDAATLAKTILGCDADHADSLFTTFTVNGRSITAKNVRERVKEWLKWGY